MAGEASAHVRAGLDGVILGYELAAAPAPELVWELTPEPLGTVPRRRNDRGPACNAGLVAAGGKLPVPYKHASRDPDSKRSAWLLGPRRRIESAIEPLRFDALAA